MYLNKNKFHTLLTWQMVCTIHNSVLKNLYNIEIFKEEIYVTNVLK